MTYLYFGIFNILAAIVLIYLNFRNEELLSEAQKKERSRALFEANSLSRIENWSFLAAILGIFLINYLGFASISSTWINFLILGQTLYTIFRNRAIYLRLELPEAFITREILYRLGILALVAVFMFFIV
ncbi:MAG: hypothetical protein KIS76_17805 [Pyrinomonadaceae bacterium]|nr:hypothetical protein [Pyrinomonadaceae bacterium]